MGKGKKGPAATAAAPEKKASSRTRTAVAAAVVHTRGVLQRRPVAPLAGIAGGAAVHAAGAGGLEVAKSSAKRHRACRKWATPRWGLCPEVRRNGAGKCLWAPPNLNLDPTESALDPTKTTQTSLITREAPE